MIWCCFAFITLLLHSCHGLEHVSKDGFSSIRSVWVKWISTSVSVMCEYEWEYALCMYYIVSVGI